MPDPSYVIENSGRKAGLAFHLSTAFYPPLEPARKQAIMRVFCSYWDGEITVEDLPTYLYEEAGYCGGLDRCGFWHFILEEDMGHA